MKNSEIKDEFKAKGLSQAKEKMRVDSLSESERALYETYVKAERIRQNEFDSAIIDAVAELQLKVEEAKAREQEERKLKEEAKAREQEAKATLKKMIQRLQSKGFTLEEIALDLEKTVAEIKAILD